MKENVEFEFESKVNPPTGEIVPVPPLIIMIPTPSPSRYRWLAPPLVLLVAASALIFFRGPVRSRITPILDRILPSSPSEIRVAAPPGEPQANLPKMIWSGTDPLAESATPNEPPTDDNPNQNRGEIHVSATSESKDIHVPATGDAKAIRVPVSDQPKDTDAGAVSGPTEIRVAAAEVRVPQRIVVTDRGPELVSGGPSDPGALASSITPTEIPKSAIGERVAQKPQVPEPLPLEEQPAKPEDKDKILADIARESAAKAAERKRNAKLKGPPSSQEKITAHSAQLERVRKAVLETQQARAEFHRELRTILAKKSPRAAARIRTLADRYGRTTIPEVEAVAKILDRKSRSMSLADFVRALRQIGYPESLILDTLEALEIDRIPNRNGPRDADEALVRAARTLISIKLVDPKARPLTTTPKNPPKAPQTTTTTKGRPL